MDPNLSIDSPMVITLEADVNEVTGGFQPIPVGREPGGGGGGEPVAEPPPQFLPMCDVFHPAGTPGARSGGGRWVGELVEDFHAANAQVTFHNEELHPNEGLHAYVALRVGGAFIGPVVS